MSESYKVSGKKTGLPKVESGWKFSSRPGGWVIAESPTGERRRFCATEVKGRLDVAVGSARWFGSLIQAGRSGSSVQKGEGDLVAQFPGKVRKVLVAVGATVAEGDPLVLVEAMKMEFAVKAPFPGTVKKVLVKEGQQLSPGDRFVELTEIAGNG